MLFFNDIINAKGTPSIREDILANRPTPSQAGRLFIATNSPYGIFRDTGTAWQLVSGSGGGGGDWDTALQSGQFTNDRNYNFNNFGISFTNVAYNNWVFNNNNSIRLEQSVFYYYNSFADDSSAFYFDYSSINPYIKLGDFSGIGNYTRFLLNDSANFIQLCTGLYTYFGYNYTNYGIAMQNYFMNIGDFAHEGNSNYIQINDASGYINIYSGSFWIDDPLVKLEGDTFKVGDFTYNVSNAQLIFDRLNNNFGTFINGYQYGINIALSDGLLSLGDQYGYSSGSWIDYRIDDGEIYFRNTSNFEITNSAQTIINATSFINLNSDYQINLTYANDGLTLSGTGITQGTSGPTVGTHLKVKINGVDYVIQLRQP